MIWLFFESLEFQFFWFIATRRSPLLPGHLTCSSPNIYVEALGRSIRSTYQLPCPSFSLSFLLVRSMTLQRKETRSENSTVFVRPSSVPSFFLSFFVFSFPLFRNYNFLTRSPNSLTGVTSKASMESAYIRIIGKKLLTCVVNMTDDKLYIHFDYVKKKPNINYETFSRAINVGPIFSLYISESCRTIFIRTIR